MTIRCTYIAFSALPLFFLNCASTGHLNTASGKPEVVIHGANWKSASIAIAEYNFSKGRKLDRVLPTKIVLYEAVPSTEGKEEITCETIYDLLATSDSVMITSRRFQTEDLDDSDVAESTDQATFDAEQQELDAIAAQFAAGNTNNIAQPVPAQ